MKIIKNENYRIDCFIASIAEVVCIVILVHVFGNIKISSFYIRGNRGEVIVLLGSYVYRCSTSVSIRYKILIIRKLPSNNISFVE